MRPLKGFPVSLSSTDRLAMAKARTDRMVDHIASLFALNEANRHVIYSDELSKQIPRSYAAHAFQQFQMSMHLFELIRLCALWDKTGRDRESIPTVLSLIEDSAIEEGLVADTYRFYAEELTPTHLTPFTSTEHENAYRAWWERERIERAETEAQKARTWILNTRQQASEIEQSVELAAMRDYRDRYIAHNLIVPEASPELPSKVIPLKYGYENKVLSATVAVVDQLHLLLNGASFDWDSSREIASKNASSLWGACSFGITY